MAISDLSKDRLNALSAATQEIGLGTVIQTAENAIDTAEAAIDVLEAKETLASASVGFTHHVKITTAGGATASTDKALPTGTWEVIDCYAVLQGAGTTSDTVQLKDDSDNAISDAIDIANGSDHDILRAGSINDANAEGLVGGTDALRVTETDGGGSDSPALDLHVILRKTA